MHCAATGEEAREIVLDSAADRGVRMAVKSKSMATEEIDLNEALERAGVTPVETDLGEYIIQLAHEKPLAHHRARHPQDQGAGGRAVLARAGAERLAADPEVLTAVARDELLREKFLQADMGITGANFAVADTGTIVLVTNEGNGRMVTSLPRIHVAVMGVEKVVPSMTDLMVFLAILARSATGQKLSSYTTLVRGPRRAGELEGPEEFHLILLDNGRSRQIAGPLREALYCLRCGACLNVCPVYRQIGGHAYGYTYPGPIGILLTAMLKGNRVGEGARPRLVALRGLQGRLPGAHRHPAHAGRAARERRPRRRSRRGRSGSCSGPSGAAPASPAAFALSARIGRLAAAAVRPRRAPARPAARSSGSGRARATCRPWRRAPSASAGRSSADGHARGVPRRGSAREVAQDARAASGASTAPRPPRPARAAEAMRREMAERWPEALERFRPRVRARGRGVPPRAGPSAAVPAT